MSDYRAIAGATISLRSLLRDRLEDVVPVTIAPPDVRITGFTGRRINVYLYQVSETPFLKNQDIPGRGHPGSLGRPPLSLTLQYLLTAYGENEETPDADLAAQRVLGDAMRVLHEVPVLTDDLEFTNPAAGPVGDPILDASLRGEFERLKVTFQPLNLEEMTKIWTAMPESSFRRSVAYEASVIQIESRRPQRVGLPVRRPLISAIPFASPRIVDAHREPPLDGLRAAIVASGETLRLEGYNFAGANTRVRLAETSIPVTPARDDRVDVIVPPSIPAGVQAAMVERDLMLGDPPVAHRGFRSNTFAFMVVPTIAGAAPVSAGPGATVTVTVSPTIRGGQRAELVLGDFVVGADPIPTTSPPAGSVSFRLPSGADRIPAGTYLLRVRIDGAESRLTVDPVTGAFNGPTYVIT